MNEYTYEDLVNDAFCLWAHVGHSFGSSVDIALDESYLTFGTAGEEWLAKENKTRGEFATDVWIKIKNYQKEQ